MNANQIEVLLFVLAPAVASMAAGLIATVRPPGGKVRGAILHFAGGVVFSVVAVELIPDLLREHAPVYTTLGFALGVATMLGVRALLESDETGEEGELDLTNAPTNGRASNSPRSSIPMAMLIATGVDLGVDGILLGIGFAAGAKEGRMVLVVIVEVVVLERLVGVLVDVALAYQQNDAERHQTHRAELGQAERIAEERHGGGGPDEGGRGEIGGLAGRTV